jgi:hypothetical protein
MWGREWVRSGVLDKCEPTAPTHTGLGAVWTQLIPNPLPIRSNFEACSPIRRSSATARSVPRVVQGWRSSPSIATARSVPRVVHGGRSSPSRGLELGCNIKYRNTESISRNFVFHHGQSCTIVEYNKARERTNYSFYVVRYLPEQVSMLMFIYLVYIRPFAKMLYRNTLLFEPKRNAVSDNKSPHSVSKKAGRRRAEKKTPSESAELPKSSKTWTRTWIVDTSFVPMSRSTNVGRGWSCPRFCKRHAD